MYGHVEKLAEEIIRGATSVEGVEAKLWQVCKVLLPLELHDTKLKWNQVLQMYIGVCIYCITPLGNYLSFYPTWCISSGIIGTD